MKRHYRHALRLLAAATGIYALAACASIGRPEGGERDFTPPVYVHSDPAPGTLNFTGDRLNIYFDENIKVEDVMNKVVVSPVQKSLPQISANGHRLTVQFRDTMIPDVTYTVDFSDAVRDLNEGNVLEGFAFDFSTGGTRDSLVIAGMVLEARTLEPAQGMIVGVYSNLSDTALTTLPLERIAKTNQYGQFVIRNLAEGTYRLFAVNDVNRDYHWDISEDVAFYDIPVTPTIEHITVTDTLRASNGTDSIVSRAGVRYMPNDLLLTWFNENYRSQYLSSYSRIDSTRVLLEFGAPVDSLPTLTLINTPAAGRQLLDIALLEHSAAADSIVYWLRDPDVIAADTLMIEARYRKTDSIRQLTWVTDTLRIINRDKSKGNAKKKDKKDPNDTIAPPRPHLTLTAANRGVQELNRPLALTISQPAAQIDLSAIRLEEQRDTLWVALPHEPIVRDSINRLLDYSLHYDWQPGTKYRLHADSAAIVGIYGLDNDLTNLEFTSKKLDDYSTVQINITDAPADVAIMVELLNSQDKPVAKVPLRRGVARFDYVTPSTYYVRAYADVNDNGLWDTGSIADLRQPEDVWYYPRKIEVKKNWDISQSWALDDLPIDQQKPYDIKKNRPKTRPGEQPQRPSTDDEDESTMQYNPGFGSSGRTPGRSGSTGRSGSSGGFNRIGH